MIAILPPLGPTAFASVSAASFAPLTLSVASSGTFFGCGSVPESMLSTLIPARDAVVEISVNAVESVAAYTRPFTPCPM